MSTEDFRKLLREYYKRMLLSKAETANELNVSEATIDRLRKNGELNSKKVLGQVMFSIDEIALYLSEMK